MGFTLYIYLLMTRLHQWIVPSVFEKQQLTKMMKYGAADRYQYRNQSTVLTEHVGRGRHRHSISRILKKNKGAKGFHTPHLLTNE